MITIPFLVGLAVFVAFACFAVVFVPAILYWAAETRRLEKYNQEVDGYGMRLKDCPFDLLSVKSACDFLVDEVATVYNVPLHRVRAKLDEVRVEFIEGVDGELYFVDERGGKRFGDHSGDRVRVAYVAGRPLAATAFVHELGHELAEFLCGNDDDMHTLADLWVKPGGCVEVARTRLREHERAS